MRAQGRAGMINEDEMAVVQVQDPNFLQIQADREGARWWLDAVAPPVSIGAGRSAIPVSAEAIDMLVAFAVRDRDAYEAFFRHAYWPGGAAGATFGIGYDLGYATSAVVASDWEGFLDGEWIHKLVSGLGLHGEPGGRLLAGYFNEAGIDIPWETAVAVFRDRVVPRWVAIVEQALPNTDLLTPHQVGALVSLAYSRGAQFSMVGDRYSEMRKIAALMEARSFARIPGEIRAMARLWPDQPGLRNRRQMEAALFETGVVSGR